MSRGHAAAGANGALDAAAIVAAAGSGERLGAGGPKALVELAGRPMVEWSLLALAASETVGRCVVAVPAGHEAEVRLPEGAGEGFPAGFEVVAGGTSRSESVSAALAAVEAELVVVHDAARPLVTAELIDAVLTALRDDAGAACVVAAAPVTDTVKEVRRGREVDRTLDRSALWAVQTPQAFRSEALRRGLEGTDLLAQATDDAMLVERLGERVVVRDAPRENVKVTTELDFRIAAMLLGERAGA